MNDLIVLLEANNHSINFEYNRCHTEMFGQLTEINLRQKYFRVRTPDKHGYNSESFVKSDKLEFQIGSYARKGWIDKDNKKLEEYLPAIYSKIEAESKEWAELRERQRIDEDRREAQRKIDEGSQDKKPLKKKNWKN